MKSFCKSGSDALFPRTAYGKIIVFGIYCGMIYAVYMLFGSGIRACLVPFFLGWLVAYVVQRPVRELYEKNRFPKKVTGALCIFLLTALPASVVFLCASKLVSYGYSLYEYAADNLGVFFKAAQELTAKAAETFSKLPFFDDNEYVIASRINEYLSRAAEDISSKAVSLIPTAAAQIASLIPKAIIFTVIYSISAFYLSCDFSEVNSFFLKFLSPRQQNACRVYKSEFFSVTKKYFRAYFMIFLLSLTELFIGLSVIGIPKPFLTAVLIAFVDILPVLGCGTVIVPWSVICFIGGDAMTGISLLVMYAVISLVRQFAEPRIVGGSIGLHPLASLMCVFLGFAVLGVPGMFVAPVGVISFINTKQKLGVLEKDTGR